MMGSRYNNNYNNNDTLTWTWTPTADQQKLFEEWQNFCLGYLVSSREGINARSIPHFVEDHVGEPVPVEKMGFPTANHFLYQMRAYIEVRKLDGKLFIFVKDYMVPEHLHHVRQMVLQQQKDKSTRTKSGIIKRPTKNQSLSTSVEDLLRYAPRPQSQTQQFQQGNNRPTMAPVGNRGTGYRGRNQFISRPAQSRISNNNNKFLPRTSTPIRSDYRNAGVQNKSPINKAKPNDYGRFYVPPKPSNGPAPFRTRFVPGLVDDDFKSDESNDDFEYYSGGAEPPVKANILSRNSVATTNKNMNGFDEPIIGRITLAKASAPTNATSPRKPLNDPPSSEPQVVNGLSSEDIPIINLRITEVKPVARSAGIRLDEPKPKAASQLRPTVAQGSANAAKDDGDVIDFNLNDKHTLEPNGLSSCPFKDWKTRLPYPKRAVIFPDVLFGGSQAKIGRSLRTFLLSQ